MASPTPRSRRAPKQERSRAIVDAIVAAGRELLARDGPAAVTTNHIAERAGVSIGSLYRYFPDKDAVLAAVYEAETARDVAEIRGAEEWAIDAAPLAEAVAMIVDFQLERHRRLLELGTDFYRGHHEEFQLAARVGSRELEARMLELLQRHAGALHVRDLETAAFMLARGASAIVRRAVEERPEKLSDPAFRRELLDLFERYLCG